jgi:hypothetical protein
MGGSRKLVDECEIKDCPAWVYRFGKNPALKGVWRGGKSSPQIDAGQGFFI